MTGIDRLWVGSSHMEVAWTIATRVIAFDGVRAIGEGRLGDVALLAKVLVDRDPAALLRVFDAATSDPIELDLRGTSADVLGRLRSPPTAEEEPQPPPQATRRGPGRPRLGVVAREVTLLPRHWEWLASQPGGASVALRKLVEVARRSNEVSDRIRRAREVAWRFMQVMAADSPTLEEASRALFSGRGDAFEHQIADWPPDVAAHARRLAQPSWNPIAGGPRGDVE